MTSPGSEIVKDIEPLVEPELLTSFPFSFLQKACFLPLRGENGKVLILTADPLQLDLGEIQSILGKEVKLQIGPADLILDIIQKYYYHPSSSKKIIADLQDKEMEVLQEEINGEGTDLLDLANKAPVIRLVNQILYRAVSMRATDIHLQTTETSFRIRYRIDGMLYDMFVLPRKYQPAVISRIKIMSNLDIAEKRIPQDGRTTFKADNQQIDVRVSIIPTFFGESAVLRLLNKASFLFDMEKLGLQGDTYETFNRLIHYDHGIILLTGPTGSGKTTTLYAALSRINKPEIHIVTLEDPVEYNLEGINQINVNTRAGLTFANGLRSILRHDPDIIMVGEIRDQETAEMAIQASLTGHLVFSTLHTNDAPSAITRLLDMGIEPYLIASSLVGVMAQRLVRLNCPECSQPVNWSSSLLADIGIAEKDLTGADFRQGKGCPRCLGTGYYSRSGIFELLFVDEKIRNLITKEISAGVIKKAALESGMKTLRMDGARKVLKGETTVTEVLRVTQDS